MRSWWNKAVLIVALLLPAAAWGQSRVDQLNAAAAISDTDKLPVCQGCSSSTTLKAGTALQLATFVLSGGGAANQIQLTQTANLTTSGADSRPNIFTTTLTSSGNTANTWENLNSFLTNTATDTLSGEINLIHAYYQSNAGSKGNNIETFESSALNSGASANFTNYLGILTNDTAGTITGSHIGMSFGFTNNNTAAGSINEFDALLLQSMGGTGTTPTNYFFLRNKDANASSALLGSLALGTIGANPNNLLFIQGKDAIAGTSPILVKNSAATIIMNLTDAGTLASPTVSATTEMDLPSLWKINNTIVSTTAAKLNLLTSAGGTTGTASSNVVFSAAPTITGGPTITDGSASLTLGSSTYGTCTALTTSANVMGCTGSDRRLKNDLGTLSPKEALEFAVGVSVHLFTFKNPAARFSDNRRHIGLFAQDVREKAPMIAASMVTKMAPTRTTPDGTETVDYLQTGPIALAAIKELKREIDGLKRQMAKRGLN